MFVTLNLVDFDFDFSIAVDVVAGKKVAGHIGFDDSMAFYSI